MVWKTHRGKFHRRRIASHRLFPQKQGIGGIAGLLPAERNSLSLSLSLSWARGVNWLNFLEERGFRSLLSPNENVVPSQRKVASYSSSSFDSSLYTVINASDSFAPSLPRNGCNYRSVSSFLHLHSILYFVFSINLYIKVSSSIIND